MNPFLNWLACYRAPAMGRFLALILTCLVSLSLTAGTAARAAEPIRCVGSDAAAHIGYVDDVREQVPSEDDKAAALHHGRSEEHTSELQSLMRISYAVFCLKKKNKNK